MKPSRALVALCSIATSVQSRVLNTASQASGSSSINGSEYEYVIVGSGAGGGPLAARLALAGHSVLIIEAGHNTTDSLQYNVPALHAVSSEYVEHRWDYWIRHYDDDEQQARDPKTVYTLPNGTQYVGLDPPQGAEMKGVLYPRVGGLGGCTAHNALITVYPNAVDWENLVDVTGDDSWAPDNMRKYFKRLEKATYLPNSIIGHGFEGWLQTSLTELTLIVQDLKVLSLVLAAATAMGQSLIASLLTTVTGFGQVLLRDINNAYSGRDSSEGLYQVPLAMKTPEYKRASPNDFLQTVVSQYDTDGSRKYKLDIALDTLATSIRFDETSGLKATGINFLTGRSLYGADPRRQNGSATSTGIAGYVSATREVIISAGAFNTPQLLKLSGIGPESELTQHGIPTKLNLQGVGKNLQDRYEVAVAGRAPTEIDLVKDCTFLEGDNDPCLTRWQNYPIEKGTYGTNGVALAILKKSSVAANDTTDLFIAGWPAHFTGYEPNYFQKAISGKNAWSWVTLAAHTRNSQVGTVTLRSSNPQDMPAINFRYFNDTSNSNSDLTALMQGTKYSRKIFQDLILPFNETYPGSSSVQTDDQWKEYIKNQAWGHHACCTAKIGADHDENAVLDKNFKVRGTRGLRVVDASVFPQIPGYFIAVPIYMVSEKAAEVILDDAARK
ncbi:hypothetical protein AC579_3478 [Pseudocercospora musae]|uniref:Glucose-methanol-choline oxidoreductase N-terminal domain-containing protein n=1 Tax=Pseudocercospora musae TaxID=113226 RepID=A0A139I857_9PEZI|nr:hypothetical protein AC579_3478 [Pseudocercospora musae]